jgi:hypothetical protein
MGDFVVYKPWGVGIIKGITGRTKISCLYLVKFQFEYGCVTHLQDYDMSPATDTEILAARLQGICPSLTS